MEQHKVFLQLKKGTGLSTYPHSLEAEPFDTSPCLSAALSGSSYVNLCQRCFLCGLLDPGTGTPALAAEVPCVRVDSRLMFLNTVTRLLLSGAGPRSLWESMQSRFMVRLTAFIGVKAAHLLEFALVVLAKSSVTLC